eukprot:TRINITY_DN43892_c0_g1_i1.p1 TRINITY_DN43892_c0_g1~~TRINITY_DN43892_c0_g1_i1.p1  ORF type:complete len:212 (+),score=38.95 TRINITY_DN43892_c0_g1_i1:70-636(+)
MGAVLLTMAKRWRHGWPKARTILKVIKPAVAKQHVDLSLLKEVSDSWSRRSQQAFLHWYGRFDHIGVRQQRKRGTYWEQQTEIQRKADRKNTKKATLDLEASLALSSGRVELRRHSDAALVNALLEQSQLQRQLQLQVQEQTFLIRELQTQLKSTVLESRTTDSNHAEFLQVYGDGSTQGGPTYSRLV